MRIGHHEFNSNLFRDPVVMIDGGAMIGEFALPFFRQYRGAAICVEPCPSSAATLRENSPPGMIVIEAAIWTSNGEAVLRTYAEHPDRNTLFIKDGTNPDNVIKVKTITLDRILAGTPWVDMLKLDIEGAEFDVLLQSKLLGEKVGQIDAELHYFNSPDESFHPSSRQEMRDALSENFHVGGMNESGRYAQLRAVNKKLIKRHER